MDVGERIKEIVDLLKEADDLGSKKYGDGFAGEYIKKSYRQVKKFGWRWAMVKRSLPRIVWSIWAGV